MDSSKERVELITRLRDLPNQLAELIDSLGATQLDTPCGPGEWTARQVVHHLVDAHINGFVRMRLILTENKPILKPYDQDAWSQLDDMTAPVELSLNILRGLHERWYLMLRALPEESWPCEGVHLDNGLVSLGALLKLYVGHGEEHSAQLRRLIVSSKQR